MEITRENRQQIVDEQSAKFEAVCKALGWVVERSTKGDDDSWWAHVTARPIPGQSGCAFMCKRNGEKRVSVSAHMDDNKVSSYGLDRVEIGVSMDKSADQIARDILRRFMPGFVKYSAELTKRVRENARYENKVTANIERLKGEPADADEKTSHKINLFHYPEVYGSVQVSEGSARFDIGSVPIDKAEKIMAILRAL